MTKNILKAVRKWNTVKSKQMAEIEVNNDFILIELEDIRVRINTCKISTLGTVYKYHNSEWMELRVYEIVTQGNNEAQFESNIIKLINTIITEKPKYIDRDVYWLFDCVGIV